MAEREKEKEREREKEREIGREKEREKEMGREREKKRGGGERDREKGSERGGSGRGGTERLAGGRGVGPMPAWLREAEQVLHKTESRATSPGERDEALDRLRTELDAAQHTIAALQRELADTRAAQHGAAGHKRGILNGQPLGLQLKTSPAKEEAGPGAAQPSPTDMLRLAPPGAVRALELGERLECRGAWPTRLSAPSSAVSAVCLSSCGRRIWCASGRGVGGRHGVRRVLKSASHGSGECVLTAWDLAKSADRLCTSETSYELSAPALCLLTHTGTLFASLGDGLLLHHAEASTSAPRALRRLDTPAFALVTLPCTEGRSKDAGISMQLLCGCAGGDIHAIGLSQPELAAADTCHNGTPHRQDVTALLCVWLEAAAGARCALVAGDEAGRVSMLSAAAFGEKTQASAAELGVVELGAPVKALAQLAGADSFRFEAGACGAAQPLSLIHI